MFTYAAYLSFILRYVYALPVPETGAVELEPSYEPAPQRRGTVGVITSCIVTLTLCVWTTIHLNVLLSQQRRRWTPLLSKLRWTIAAMFIPEVVVWIAFQQRRAVQTLRIARSSSLKVAAQRHSILPVLGGYTNGCQDIALYPPHSDSTVTTGSDEPFSMEFCFFVVMGGFQIEVPGEYSWISDDRKILTADGVLLLANLGLLPEFGNRKIRDRGKNDWLSKSLILIQISWMLVSTVARGISRLPITLLELNTLAHIGCAGWIYFFWWHKPQDVVEPEILHLDAPVTAFLASHRLRRKFTLCTEQSKESTPKYIICEEPQRHEPLAAGVLGSTSIQNIALAEVGSNEPDDTEAVPVQEDERRRKMTELDPAWFCLAPGDIFLDNEFLKRVKKAAPEHFHERDFKILQLLSEFYGRPKYPEAAAHLLHNKCLQFEIKNARLNVSANNNPGFEIWLLAVFTLVYGGIHAISWNWYFPSTAERQIWRISACMVAGEGVLSTLFTLYLVLPGVRGVLLCCYVVQCCGVADKCDVVLPTSIVRISRCIWRFYTVLLLVAGTAMYIGPRVYLVVESFISLRTLPVGAYDTVQWTQLALHWG